VKSYEASTGLVKIEGSLKFYHWGARQSTEYQYNGVDIRCEVLLLSRNIRISGEFDEKENWGASFVTASVLEWDFTQRHGLLEMDNVELYNIGQLGTEAGTLRILKAKPKEKGTSKILGHRITNCGIHNGDSMGVEVS